MENPNMVSLLHELEDNLDDLEEALAPFNRSFLMETAGKLPLLDKAQLYVLVTYAIESILFSYLRLNGVDAKQHAIFRELARVKLYFEKIKAAENIGSKRENLSLDRAAAGRFIKHALSGNKYDAKRAEHSASDKPRAHIRFGESSTEQPDGGAGKAISSTASASLTSSDLHDLRKFDGQAKATSAPHNRHKSVDSTRNSNSEALGMTRRKRRRKEQSTEGLQE